ncbi:ATP-dependent nuclease [Shinella fusca]|uniref:ABC-type Na+ transport system ATPase subunit NatA n=1 Tax=Shinella fusca TaxID=544480 RepID=A0A7W7YQV9_9HYPH|nr:AAA family ATPase [Shinella fusca]MBB5040696.1 ABC-type Na+ transport system ATPase subunit NatA [Shinella fusca]
MRYTKFRIQNFKGIKDTTIDLNSGVGASVFPLVGLNESGKTTILEAIYSFSPDLGTRDLIDRGLSSEDDSVPRHLLSSFTGTISVAATLAVDGQDRRSIARMLAPELTLEDIPDEITMFKERHYKNGDKQSSGDRIEPSLRVKKKGERKFRKPNDEEFTRIWRWFFWRTPSIAYYPTFVFDFPKKIYLSGKFGAKDALYRRVFQDILDQDGQGHTIEESIVQRVQNEDFVVSWTNFLSLWSNHRDRDKIQQVMDRASSTVTKVVLGRWNEIFGEKPAGKEIVISYDVTEGEETNKAGIVEKTLKHNVVIKFHIRDGTRRFEVNDRSLGFRWFFAFMLFTQFRVARDTVRPVLFLFDEPAANLHAAAQQKLIDSFPEIAKDQHMLIYTTHSHYMIEPKWLEQTFIVTNRADAPTSSIMDAVSLDDESLDIRATKYRVFVNDHPSQTSYFQPILDRLNVVPSKFDSRRQSVITEGKSDYYIMRYAIRLLGMNEIALLPAMGAGTLDALLSIHMGWGLDFLFVLDSDKQGKSERERYLSEFAARPDDIVGIGDLVPGLTEIEKLLDDDALDLIAADIGATKTPTKNQIRRFFQERLAADDVIELTPKFRQNATELLEAVNLALSRKQAN